MTEINGSYCTSPEALYEAAEAAAILGTLQAGYTNFTYLDDATREITDREALLGVSITGWMTNPQVLFDEDVLKSAAQLVVSTNKKVAALIGINQAARCTTVKPSGNASVLLGTSSGIHGDHAPRYFRNIQLNNTSEVTQLLADTNPKMVEEYLANPGANSSVISFPIVADEHAIFKDDLLGVKLLEYVKIAKRAWVDNGKVEELCVDPRLSHNVSNTITVDDWDEVSDYIFNNREHFAGISLMGAFGDKAMAQSPFTQVFTADEILEKYGVASVFASGLIVDGNHAFSNDLWLACDTALGWGKAKDLKHETSDNMMQRDWVRRAKKFAKNYFDGDVYQMTCCLKDVHNLHRWEGIFRELHVIDYATELKEKVYTEVDTMGAQACSGDSCEINIAGT